MLANIRLLQMRLHRASDTAPHPFIEIAQNDTRTVQFLMIDDSRLKQPPRLAPVLEKGGSQVDVENVKSRTVESDIRAQTTARQPAAAFEIVMETRFNGIAGEN